jgi:hypothetical protein
MYGISDCESNQLFVFELTAADFPASERLLVANTLYSDD